MSSKKNVSTLQIIRIMHVIAWVVFIGLLIKAGAILFVYVMSLIKPEVSSDLYQGLDMSALRQYDLWHYSLIVSFIVALPLMKAQAMFYFITILGKVDLQFPFKMELVRLLEKLSQLLLGIWLVGILDSMYTKWLRKFIDEVPASWNGSEFIFIAGIVFVISQIYKRGVEIQTENDLTV